MTGRDAELKAALRQLPAPEPGADLLGRILRSRALGVRGQGSTREAAMWWRWVAAAGVLTILVGGTWVLSLSITRMKESRFGDASLEEVLRGTGMLPPAEVTELSAERAKPRYGLVLRDALAPSRLSEGVWTYRSSHTTDDVLTQPLGGRRIRLARRTFADRPAWMLNSSRVVEGVRESADTTYLDAASLRPLYTVAQGYKRRFLQVFSADSAYEFIDFNGAYGVVLKSFRGSVAIPIPSDALFFNDWDTYRLAALFPALPLAKGWRGTVYQVAFISQIGSKGFSPVDVRVLGTERVTVPAGTFDCWRVEIEIHMWQPQHLRMWVSRDKGWLSKEQSRGSDFVVNTVLESYEPGN